MAQAKDPTEPIRKQAASLPDVATGTSCNQSSFKVGKSSFLFIGPGAKGVGYKAMFKLDRSMPEARKLATKDPEHFEVGSTAWVTARFADATHLPKSIWQKWLKESYELCRASGKSVAKNLPIKKKTAIKKVKKTPAKKRGKSSR